MLFQPIRPFGIVTLAALACGAATAAFAQAPNAVGQARISDGGPSAAAIQPASYAANHGGGYYDDGSSGSCEHCQGGRGNVHYIKDGLYLNGKNYCTGRCTCMSDNPTLNWLFCERYCTHSPDHGWAPPTKNHPMTRNRVEYQRFWPSRWYGSAASGTPGPTPVFPMVYRPTDTTQLGYYYQQVPQFVSMPGMIPPPPNPAEYHVRECRDRRTCPPGYGRNFADMQNGYYGNGMPSNCEWTPVEGSPNSTEMPPAPTQDSGEMAPQPDLLPEPDSLQPEAPPMPQASYQNYYRAPARGPSSKLSFAK